MKTTKIPACPFLYEDFFYQKLLYIVNTNERFKFVLSEKIFNFVLSETKKIYIYSQDKKNGLANFKKTSKVLMKFLKNKNSLYFNYISSEMRFEITQKYLNIFMNMDNILPYVDFYEDLHEVSSCINKKSFTTEYIKLLEYSDCHYVLNLKNFKILKQKIIRLNDLNSFYFRNNKILCEDSNLKDKFIFEIIDLKKSSKKVNVCNVNLADYLYCIDLNFRYKDFVNFYIKELKNWKNNEYYRKNYDYLKDNNSLIYYDFTNKLILCQDILKTVKDLDERKNYQSVELLYKLDLDSNSANSILFLMFPLFEKLLNIYWDNKLNYLEIKHFFINFFRDESIEAKKALCLLILSQKSINPVKKLHLLKEFEYEFKIYINDHVWVVEEMKKIMENTDFSKIENKIYIIFLFKKIMNISSKDINVDISNLIVKNELIRKVYLSTQKEKIFLNIKQNKSSPKNYIRKRI